MQPVGGSQCPVYCQRRHGGSCASHLRGWRPAQPLSSQCESTRSPLPSDTPRHLLVDFVLGQLERLSFLTSSCAQVNHGKSISSVADQKLKESILEKWESGCGPAVNWSGFTSPTIRTLYLLRRYMLVDNEDDNKTHRPVAPKDVSPLFSPPTGLSPRCWCLILFFFSVGSKEAH